MTPSFGIFPKIHPFWRRSASLKAGYFMSNVHCATTLELNLLKQEGHIAFKDILHLHFLHLHLHLHLSIDGAYRRPMDAIFKMAKRLTCFLGPLFNGRMSARRIWASAPNTYKPRSFIQRDFDNRNSITMIIVFVSYNRPHDECDHHLLHVGLTDFSGFVNQRLVRQIEQVWHFPWIESIETRMEMLGLRRDGEKKPIWSLDEVARVATVALVVILARKFSKQSISGGKDLIVTTFPMLLQASLRMFLILCSFATLKKNWGKPILLLQNVKQILRKTEKYEREPVTESFTMALQQYLGLIQRVLESISKCNFSFLFFVPPPLHHHHDHHNRHLFNSPLQPAPLGSLVVPLAHFLKVSHFQPSIYFHPYLVRPLLLVRNPSALFDIGQSSCVTDADVKI